MGLFVALEREQDALREAELQKAEDEGDAGTIADAQAALERDQQETAAAATDELPFGPR